MLQKELYLYAVMGNTTTATHYGLRLPDSMCLIPVFPHTHFREQRNFQ